MVSTPPPTGYGSGPSWAANSGAPPLVQSNPRPPQTAPLAGADPHSSSAQRRTADNSSRYLMRRNMAPLGATAQPPEHCIQARLNAVLALRPAEVRPQVHADLVDLIQVTASCCEASQRAPLEQLSHEVMSGEYLDLDAVAQFADRLEKPFDAVWTTLSYLALAHHPEVVSALGAPTSTEAQSINMVHPTAQPPEVHAVGCTERAEELAQNVFPSLCSEVHSLAKTDFERVVRALWGQAAKKIQSDQLMYKPISAGRYLEPEVLAALVHQEILRTIPPLDAGLCDIQRALLAQAMAHFTAVLGAMSVETAVPVGARFRPTVAETQAVLDRQFQVFGSAHIADLQRIQDNWLSRGKSHARAVQTGLEFASWVEDYLLQFKSDTPLAPGQPIQIIKEVLTDEQGKFCRRKAHAVQTYLISSLELKDCDRRFEEIAEILFDNAAAHQPG
jgi:hypothetical protein